MEEIKKRLKRLGLRPADLARACAISPGSLSQYLNGKRECPVYRKLQFENWLELQELKRLIQNYESGTHELVRQDFRRFRNALSQAWYRLQNMDTDRSLAFVDDKYLMIANDMEQQNLIELEEKLTKFYQHIYNQIDEFLARLNQEDRKNLDDTHQHHEN